VIAALGPRMMELAAERTDGAHTYFVPPEHTERASEILGPDRLLVPEQAVVLEEDITKAREIARAHVRRYLPLPNYTTNLKRLGFTDDDFADQGSNRLVDAIVAHGDIDAIARRIREHLEAGASHVCLHMLSRHRYQFPLDKWRLMLTSSAALNGMS
jgi:probable F420-dependent oxidoreductase